MTYSQYPYVEAFIDEKQPSWIAAHVHMYKYFGGVAKSLFPITAKRQLITTMAGKTSVSTLSTMKWLNIMGLP